MALPKFPNVQSSFHSELKKRIQEYFITSGKSTIGNFQLVFKASLLWLLLSALYVHLVFFTPGLILLITESILLGGIIAGIGFNVMHDGAHGSFSKYRWVNQLAAFSLNVVGGNSFMWNIKHNIIHHAYTNIDGVDDDIDIQPWLRMSAAQKKYRLHKYQHIYFWLLYCLFYLLWIFYFDFQKYFRQKIGNMPLKKMKFHDHLTFWGFKLIHYFLFIGLPIYFMGWGQWLTVFLIYTLVAGFIVSIVFQLAHTVEETEFPTVIPATDKMPDEWAIHQIKTTADFATDNKVISWLIGGLNFQIEHHLFPKISHIHYPALSKIIRQICREYGLTYIAHRHMFQAVISHISFLRKMGRA